jgi:hypothetical protein
VNIASQLQQICIFRAPNGLVTILKQVTAAPMLQVEGSRVARQKPGHNVGNGDKPGPEQEMGMIGHQCPGKTAGLPVPQSVSSWKICRRSMPL